MANIRRCYKESCQFNEDTYCDAVEVTIDEDGECGTFIIDKDKEE